MAQLSLWHRRASPWHRKAVSMAQEDCPLDTGGLSLWHTTVHMAQEGIPTAQEGCGRPSL